MVISKKNGVVEMIVPNMNLMRGKYILDVAIRTKDGLAKDKIHHVLEFQVQDQKKDFGVMRMQTEWKV